jgi:hypothetical protein
MASALTVIERLLDDDAVHDQMSTAATHLRKAVSAGTLAAKSAAGTRPEPKRHRGLVLMLAVAAAAGAAIATSRHTAPSQS